MPEFVTGDGVAVFFELGGSGRRIFTCAGGPADDHRYLADDLAPLTGELEFVHHDYRGSGASQRASASTYNFSRLASDLDELRRAVGDERITVLGHSMGGFVALRYALDYPEHCDRIILVGTFATGIPRRLLPALFRTMGWARVLKMMARAVAWAGTAAWRRPSDARREQLYAIWSTHQEGLPEMHARLVERRRALGLPLANDNIRALQREITHTDMTNDLDRVDAPVLVLFGRRDAAAVWSATTYARHLRNVEVVGLDGIGHDVLFEAPDASAAALRAFVR